MQVSALMDSALARDRIVNVLHFEDQGTADWDGNCQDMAEIFRDHWYDNGAREIEVTAYDAEGPPPHFPKGHAVVNPGVVGAATGHPREVALCLSFYSERNLPRQRGRIYLTLNGTTHNPALRPNPTIMQKALDLGGFFAALGGVDVSWNIWSPTDHVGREVTNAWVDDEWDTVRSRGLRATTRLLAATGS